MNIATSEEQSKHLLEIGVDPSTADMYWHQCGDLSQKTLDVKYEKLCEDEIPAWSLTALLALAKSFDREPRLLWYEDKLSGKNQSGWFFELFNCGSGTKESPIDAVYTCICMHYEKEG